MSIRDGSVLPMWKGMVDPVWTIEDIVRAQTLDARWSVMGVPQIDRAKLVPIAVWKSKFPGLKYSMEIESQLKTLLFE